MKTIETPQKSHLSIQAKHFGLIVLSVLVVFFIVPFETLAQGGLLITPRRVVFDGGKRVQQLNLANTGADTATFSISFVQYRMKEDGNFEEITEPDSLQRFADKNLRLFPRTVTLAPREAQLVKLQLRNYNKLDDGECRSHLYFRTVKNTKALGENEVVDTTSLSVRLVPIFGISIPVIIRKGENTTEVNLTDLSFEMQNDTIPKISMRFNRQGNMSVYGDIVVEYTSADNVSVQVGIVRGLAVYTPNLTRHFSFELNKGIDYSKGSLSVIYKSNSDLKPAIYAQEKLILNKY